MTTCSFALQLRCLTLGWLDSHYELTCSDSGGVLALICQKSAASGEGPQFLTVTRPLETRLFTGARSCFTPTDRPIRAALTSGGRLSLVTGEGSSRWTVRTQLLPTGSEVVRIRLCFQHGGLRGKCHVTGVGGCAAMRRGAAQGAREAPVRLLC